MKFGFRLINIAFIYDILTKSGYWKSGYQISTYDNS